MEIKTTFSHRIVNKINYFLLLVGTRVVKLVGDQSFKETGKWWSSLDGVISVEFDHFIGEGCVAYD